ncbi:MAG: ABC transporter ATP-binding protein [Coriobacteriia bacterium]|nr:ABC transporter ATP-binding protein [Coriobacteriia bacterium]MCL2750601.1 ABC transporter ATP-binding protein [Coriobacteriia bacterium]
MSNISLEFKQVSKTYEGKAGEVEALKDLSLCVVEGESLAIIGPSGCGKSTLLLLASGLLGDFRGKISIKGKPVTKPRLETGLILQDYGLLPWKTVFENADLGQRIRKVPRPERLLRTEQILQQVGIQDFSKNYPGELSGGMRQRLALARVLTLEVDLLLMDEPLSSLDLELREGLQELLLKLWRQRGYTQLIVTHSIDEAVYLGERILVMSPRPGRIVTEIANPLAGSTGYRSTPEYFAKATEVRAALEQRDGVGVPLFEAKSGTPTPSLCSKADSYLGESDAS